MGENTYFISKLKPRSKYGILSTFVPEVYLRDTSGTVHLIVNPRYRFISMQFQGRLEDVCIVYVRDLFYVFSTHLGGCGSLYYHTVVNMSDRAPGDQ